MARKRITNLTETGKKPLFNRAEYNKNMQKRMAEDEINRRVDRRHELAEALHIPDGMRNDFTRDVGDRVVDAESYLKSQQFQDHALTAALLGGATGLGAGAVSYLGARNDQQMDYQPTDPFSVAGRMVNNAGVSSSVGLDPLADARNKVSEARKIVGSEAMLEALTVDEIEQLRGEQEMAMTPMEFEQMSGVQQMIDRRAEQLRGTPIQKSDGSVAPMPFDTAQRIATEQVAMELRAGQVY